MYVAGEALALDSVVEPTVIGNERDQIFAVNNVPGLLARNSTWHLEISDMSVVDDALAIALFKLTDYDIDFPGIGHVADRLRGHPRTDAVDIYTTLRFVEGLNMHDQMGQIPLEVTLQTFRNMLRYYEDMSQDYSDNLYLTDLSLRQCVYGSEADTDYDEGQPHVYFVDYGRLMNNMKGLLYDEFPYPRFRGLRGLDDDLYQLKGLFPDVSFRDEASRLLNLARYIGTSYWAATAYYEIEGAEKDVAVDS